MKNIGLYIHVPFCNGKCPYCDFFSINLNSAEADRYTNKIIEKIENLSNNTECKADTLYIGGGTPSILGTERIVSIMDSARHFLTGEYEATIEVNPTSRADVDFELLHRAGINRVSIGLQSANDNELKVLGRKHTAQDAANTVQLARKAGFENISLDLMLAVPGQTLNSLKHSIDFCKDCNVEHISAYILKIEDGTPYAKMKDSLNLFDDDTQADFYSFACDYLSKCGYYQYEISNFCKKNKYSRHNLKYWNCEEYIGIGASAHSFFEGKRFYYPRSFEDFYADRIIYDGEGGDEYEYVMLALRLSTGIIFSDFKSRFGYDFPLKKCLPLFNALSQDDLITLDNRSVHLTQKGFLVSNSIIAKITDTAF
ncbi:MAG: radical SAM family heme chaperone HemW [Acutalibacteraceae bacterium]